MIKIVQRFFYAWLFLTKLPAPPLPRATKEDWGRIAPYFVLVGFILGIVVVLSAKLFVKFNFPILFSALLTLLVWYVITGCLHLDGLIDTFDGIGCQVQERKLEAIRDSRIGAFGAIGGMFVVLFKLVCLCTLLLNKMFYVILFCLPLSRLIVVYSFTFLKSRTEQGKGNISASFILSGVKKPADFIINLFVFIVLVFIDVFFFHLSFSYVFFLLVSFFAGCLWTYWLNNHFKGHTGDTYGALIELSEVSVLSLAVIFKGLLL